MARGQVLLPRGLGCHVCHEVSLSSDLADARSILSPFFQAIAYAKANGVPDHIANYAIAIMGAGSVVGRLVMGALADRYGIWRIFTLIPFASAISIFAFWVPPNIGTAPTVVGLLLYGWMSGGFFSLMGSATASFSPLDEVGTRIGLLISSFAIPSFVGPVITGALVRPDKVTYAAIWIGCCQLVSAILLNAPAEWAWICKRFGWRQRGLVEKDCGTVTRITTASGRTEGVHTYRRRPSHLTA